MNKQIYDEFVAEVSEYLAIKINDNQNLLTNKNAMQTILLQGILVTSKKMKNKVINDSKYGVKAQDVDKVIIEIANDVHSILTQELIK